MKELSIKEKAKAYDEALERARCYKGLEAEMSNIFPELKESEDERIKGLIEKAIKSYFRGRLSKGTNDVDYAMCLAWFEKQGDKKPQGKSALEATNEEKVDNQNCVKSTDKVKPKFKVGDVIRLKGTAATYMIKRVTDTTYYTNGWSCGIERCEEDYELVEQKPAWSEEDEKFFESSLWHIKNSICNGRGIDVQCELTEWFKSLKERVHPKQEWSEKDKEDGD